MPITCPANLKPLSTEDFGQLDYSVMAHAFASHNELGRLADEVIYQGDFASRLSDAGFKVSRELPVTVSFGTFNKVYSLDIIVDEKATYELKAVAKLTANHVSQLLNYLFLLDAERGKLINLFRETVIELLRDWGTGLELSLYHQALVHVLGGDDRVSALLPMHRAGIALGNQRFFLTDAQSAFRLTAFSKDTEPYETQLNCLLRHSPLSCIHWINIDLETVTFTIIKKS